MSVYTYSIINSTDHIKSWVPSKNMELTDLGIIDINGNINYYLSLSRDGRVYIQGNVQWMDPAKYSHPTLLTGIPATSQAVEIATSLENFAVRTSDGQVFVCGANFSPTLKCIYSFGQAKQISVNKQNVLISTETSLIKYTSPSSSSTISPKDKKVVCIAPYELGFLVLLDDGILYSTFKFHDLGLSIESAIPNLYIVSGFLGPQMVFMEASLNEIICIYIDGSLVYGWADQDQESSYPVLATLPTFPVDDSCVCHAHISRDLIWFLTSTGDIYYISKLPALNPDNGHVARFKHVPEGFPSKISHFRANWNEIFLFETGIKHNPIVGHINIETLSSRVQPFMLHTQSHGSVLVDPLGAVNLGLRPGDRVCSPNGDQMIVVGRADKSLCVKEVVGRNIDIIPLPEISTILFQWKLCDRSCAHLTDIAVSNDQLTMQIDSSTVGLARFCFFKPGDEIEHAKFGHGVILGERCNALWIRYDDGKVRMCNQSTSRALHQEHKLVRRLDVDRVVQREGIDGNIILIEPAPIGSYEPGCVVASASFGCGVFLGTASSQFAINFIQDGEFCRLIPRTHSLTLKRAISTTVYPFTCLDSSVQFVDISAETCQKFGIVPGDIIKIADQVAICVGCGKYEDTPSLLFETELMIKHGLGVGVFAKGPLDVPFEMIARISYPGTVIKSASNGEKIELSINTDDFKNAELLPGDELTIDGKQCTVCGISLKDNGKVYVEYSGENNNKVCEPLGEKFILYYRRVNVPTKINAHTKEGTDVSGWIDLEHLRDSAVLPCDVVEDEEEKIAIVGAIDQNHFIVSKLSSNETGIMIVPSGKTSKVVSSVFDVDL